MALSDGDIVRFGLTSITPTGVVQVNNLHYRLVADTAFITNEPTVADTASELWTKLGTAYRATLLTSTTMQLVHGYQEVETWNGAIASSGDFVVNLAGTAALGTGQVARPLSGVIDLRSDVATRSGRGWIMLPGPADPTMLNSSGTFNSIGAYTVAAQNLAALLDDAIQHDVLGVHAWHLTPCIYSRTRRKRAQSPFTFDVKAASFRLDPRWVSRRRTAP